MSYTPAGSPNLFFSGLAVSGISGYLQLVKPPMAAAAEVDLTQALVDTDGEVLMQAWVSPALGLTEIAAGEWSFTVFGNVDTVDGASEIIARVYARNAAGSETELFYVTTGSLTASAAGYIVTSSQGILSLGALTDRLVVKFYAKTTSTGSRTVHLYYLGEARQTRMILPVELPIVQGGDMLASQYDSDGDGQIGGAASLPAYSGAMLTKSAMQSVASVTFTAITFDGEVNDTDNYHSNSSNTSRLTAPSNGYYLVGGSLGFNALPDQKIQIARIYKNGAAVDGYGQSRDSASSASYLLSHISVVVYLATGDYVELIGQHNNASALDCRTSADGTAFWIVKIAS